MNSLVFSLAELGGQALISFWIPVAAWTVVAAAVEATLRGSGVGSSFSQPVRGATLASLPASLLVSAVVTLLPPSVPRWGQVLGSEAASIVAIASTHLEPASALMGANPIPWLELGVVLASVVAALASALALLRLAVGLRRSLSLALRASADPVTQALVDDRARRLGLNLLIRTVQAPDSDAPFTVGAFRPVIGVPTTLSGEALDAAVVHELEHIRRHHFAWSLAQRTIVAVFAAHPLAHMLGRQLDLGRENQADAAVLDAKVASARSYAHLLLSFAQRPSPALALCVSSRSSYLTHRLTAMKAHLPSPQRRVRARLGILVGSITAVLALWLAVATVPQPFAQSARASGAEPIPEVTTVTVEETSGEAAQWVIGLRAGTSAERAAEIADQLADPSETDRLRVVYEGGHFDRTGIRENLLPPPPDDARLEATATNKSDEIARVEVRQENDEPPTVDVYLLRGTSAARAEAIADDISDPTRAEILRVHVGDQIIVRRGVRADFLPPPPPQQPTP